ncbi:MAG: hemerythrin domain-containing protein [Promethearchaeota archaeon]
MDPIKQLRQEHRLIEKAANVVANLRDQLKSGRELRPDKFWRILDFWSTYADVLHHGKEEQLLFPLIEEKDNSTTIATMIDQLVTEHTQMLGYIADMRQAARPLFAGNVASRKRVVDCLEAYIGIIVPHVKLEDQNLFSKIDELLSSQEMAYLTKEFESMDARVVPKVHQFFEELINNLAKE